VLLRDDKISLATSVSEVGKSLLQMEARPGNEAGNLVILSLKCLEKELQRELVKL